MALIAPRTARLIGVDDATLLIWAERGLMLVSPEEAAWMRVSDSEASDIRASFYVQAAAEDYGYVPRGPVKFADEEPRPHPR